MFRIDREPSPHLGFGIAEQFCLRANLAARAPGHLPDVGRAPRRGRAGGGIRARALELPGRGQTHADPLPPPAVVGRRARLRSSSRRPPSSRRPQEGRRVRGSGRSRLRSRCRGSADSLRARSGTSIRWDAPDPGRARSPPVRRRIRWSSSSEASRRRGNPDPPAGNRGDD